MVLYSIKKYAAVIVGLLIVLALLSLQYFSQKISALQGLGISKIALAAGENCALAKESTDEEIYFVSCGGLF